MGTLSRIFLGKTIRETQEIHRSLDAKDRVFLGLFRNSLSDVVWLKFWQRAPILGSSGWGVAIAVDSFEDFYAFLESGCVAEGNVPKPDVRVPRVLRLILRVDEGMADVRCFGEYRCSADPANRVRILTYLNRKGVRRALVQINSDFASADFKALEAIRDIVRDPTAARFISEAMQSH